ncbi:MAG: hypothetical protein R3C45_00100 [Phycisphaerales bacterium]
MASIVEKKTFFLISLLVHVLILTVGIPFYLFQLAMLAMQAEDRWFHLAGLHSGHDTAGLDDIQQNLSNVAGGSTTLTDFPGWFCNGFVILGLVAYAIAIVFGIEVIVLLYYIRRGKTVSAI